MSRLGHSRRGRANTKSGHVRCALKAEVRSIGHLERLSWVDGAARDVIHAPKLEPIKPLAPRRPKALTNPQSTATLTLLE
jgi:hypothetical protein